MSYIFQSVTWRDKMDRREFLKKSALGGAGLVLMGCEPIGRIVKESLRDGKYDFDDLLIDDYNVPGIAHVVVDFEHEGTPRKMAGSGIVHGNRIITADHVIDNTKAHIRTPFGLMEIDIEPENTKYKVNGEECELVKRFPEKDLAVLYSPLERHETEFGNSDELDLGHYLTINGFTYGAGKFTKNSRVASRRGYGNLKTYLKDVDIDDVFIHFPTCDAGDSGGAVCAYRDGNPEIVGMNKARFNQYGVAHKINDIMDILEGI